MPFVGECMYALSATSCSFPVLSFEELLPRTIESSQTILRRRTDPAHNVDSNNHTIRVPPQPNILCAMCPMHTPIYPQLPPFSRSMVGNKHLFLAGESESPGPLRSGNGTTPPCPGYCKSTRFSSRQAILHIAPRTRLVNHPLYTPSPLSLPL